ncbi:von Willebrand factor A domain-containing protein 5A-like [Protopterus annectens]|uniref:von Willebrand factor A domain-containing protein 5A-like n=1 Tax=Protopterus annectens TaxID=7888 RepID=UPI001CF9F133|nr:von Willebrand factor A domain-containing protein 5A-like [Protopterus annectens]
MTLIGLQKADGSWIVDEVLAEIFNSTTQEILTSLPCEEAEPAVWSTLLSLIWLHTYGAKIKSDWELLASKAVSWLNTNAAGVDFGELIIVGNNFLKTEVKQSTLGL